MIRLCWRGTHTAHGGVQAAGKPAQARDFAPWRFEGGKVTKISTLQDQFALSRQIGYPPEDGCAARPCPAAAAAPAQEVRQARTGTSYVPPPGTNTAAFFACAEGILRGPLSETDPDARASRSNCVMRRPASAHVPPGLKASRPGNASARAKRQPVSVMTGMLANDFIW